MKSRISRRIDTRSSSANIGGAFCIVLDGCIVRAARASRTERTRFWAAGRGSWGGGPLPVCGPLPVYY